MALKNRRLLRSVLYVCSLALSASAWAQRLGPVPGVLLAADVLGTLEQFAREVIPPMVLIGTALRQAMDAGLRQRRL